MWNTLTSNSGCALGLSVRQGKQNDGLKLRFLTDGLKQYLSVLRAAAHIFK